MLIKQWYNVLEEIIFILVCKNLFKYYIPCEKSLFYYLATIKRKG